MTRWSTMVNQPERCADMIPFNKPHLTGKELQYISDAHQNTMLAGDGPFTERCHTWIERKSGTKKALLTHSCTAALEMAALLLDIGPGDEIIMPSFTFVSTANAFVLRGGVPVFVDIREDTLNIDETLIEAAITSKTKAIAVVHYAGIGCEMDTIIAIAQRHGLHVVEDAAQGVMATYKGRPLGSIGSLGAYSFHETKNVISGEGGALLVNDDRFAERAEIIREKGTDRRRFSRGQVDKYTWQDLGSSFLPGELVAAFLWAQLEEAESITRRRIAIWNRYHSLVAPLEESGLLRRPVLPPDCQHNAHMYYVLLDRRIDRRSMLSAMNSWGLYPVFHYVPLHSSPAGQRFCRQHGPMTVTDYQANRLVRLPFWVGLSDPDLWQVVEALNNTCKQG